MPQDNPVMDRLLRKAKVSSTGRPSDIHKNLYKAIRRATGILPKDMASHLMLSPAGYAHVEHNGIITVTNEVIKKLQLIGKDQDVYSLETVKMFHADAKAIGEEYRKATTTLSDAEILYGRMQREGFHSYEADASLRDARRAIREGSYARTIEHLERAMQAFARRTNARVALGKAIEETRTRVRFLQRSGLAFLPDIQEVLGRAEREFNQGNFSGSGEDLRIATVLLDEVTRAPLAKK